MNSAKKFIAVVALTVSSSSFSFLSYDSITTNSCYLPSNTYLNGDMKGNLENSYKYIQKPTNSYFDNCINSTTSSYTLFEVDKMSIEQKENIEIINSFKNLDNAWDGYDSLAPKKDVINLVLELIKKLNMQPEVFPTPDGGIQLEYSIGENQHLNIEILSETEVIIFEMFSDRTYEENNVKFDIDLIQRRVNEFYGRI